MEAGKLIKELRLRKGMTQEELAAKTELSTRTIQRIENGEVDPRAYTLQMIAKALEVEFSLFVEDETTEDKGKKDKYILGLLHLSGFLPLFIPTVLIWNSQKNKGQEIATHYREVLGFQLTVWLIFILPGLALSYFFSINHFINKAPYLIFVGIAFGAVSSIFNAINVVNDKPYKSFNILKLNK
jgi:transcriptional regulator with XRE-family HTH domain